jgi:nitrate reductase assembly molybdenum cofactor insertion protein NarJ
MTWHLVGDAPERGALLSMLRDDLARAGISERGELPDHLAVLLRLMGRGDARAASELAALIAPAIAHVRDELKARDNPYADVLDAVGCMVAASRTSEERP